MNPVTWLWLTLPLGVCRAMQIAMHDKITEKPRGWIERVGGYPAFSIECPWCTATQIGLVTAAFLAWDETRRVTAWILLGLAVSLVAVLADRIIDRVPYLEDRPTHGTLPDHRPEPPPEVRAVLDAET